MPIDKMISNNDNNSSSASGYNKLLRFIKVVVLLMNILFLNHLVACFWHFLAKFDNFSEDTWVLRYNLYDEPAEKRYIAAFYWSFQTLTTVGYGDIAPQTEMEKVYAMMWMFFGVGFFSYTLGNLSAIMSSIGKKTQEYNKKVNQFNDFAFKVKLPIEIRNKVHSYYQNNYYKMMYNNLDPNFMIQELPPKICQNLLMYCFGFLKQEISLFQLDENFTARIILNLYYMSVEKGEVIYREGDNPEEVFFLGSGKVNLLEENGNAIVTMIEGCFFGEIEVLEEEPKRRYFAVAMAEQATHLYFIKKDAFLEILEDFPNVDREIREIIKRRKEKYRICEMLVQKEMEERQLFMEYQQQEPHNQIEYNIVKQKQQPKLKKSTEHYLNLLLMYKEKTLQKKNNSSQRSKQKSYQNNKSMIKKEKQINNINQE
ncbi:Cyclic nucleotide-binding protein [Pseudocohnilembus persalinus]|uniref:Cyclic nucleotide-binding protein n=1 Tax=Pseudocohnilembus persalinus TaxID=266149 RepID=A0A0V0QJY7_PSEPJ|nr:Cyclic nucleotide-binding protein [Pseudocohnilembus persalinus]|eukprot:KRX02605.1 Cyclic nucleotide-binding protein [Pseudocohnilembus persalinus]